MLHLQLQQTLHSSVLAATQHSYWRQLLNEILEQAKPWQPLRDDAGIAMMIVYAFYAVTWILWLLRDVFALRNSCMQQLLKGRALIYVIEYTAFMIKLPMFFPHTDLIYSDLDYTRLHRVSISCVILVS